MKNIIKRFWGVGLIVIILSSMFIVASPVSAADPLRWESKSGGPSTTFNAISTGTNILDYAVAPNGATIYAACGAKFFQSTNGGSTWTDITSRLPAGYDSVINVALAPDDPNIVVAVANNTTTGALVAISVNGGVTFTDTVLTGTTNVVLGVDISPVVTGGFRYVSVFGRNGASNAATLWYFNYGAGVGGWKNAVATTLGGFTAPAAAATIDNIVALQFSPNFASDYMALALSEQFGGGGTENGTLRLHVLSFNSFKWDNIVAAGYPVTVAAESGNLSLAVNKASIAVGPDYMGGDETTRIAFVGAAISGTAVTGGIWRCNDIAPAKKIFDGVNIASLTYDGTTLVAGAYDSNIVYHCTDMLGSSPTVIGSRSLKAIGLNDPTNLDLVNVQFVGATVFGSKQGLGGALSKSTDAGTTWNDFSLINMSLTNYDDLLPSADGTVWYLSVRDGFISAIFRMSPMQRVLCTAVASSAPKFMLRGLATDPNVVYAADKGGTTIYYSADGGVSRWQQRLNVPAAIQDLAVESANVIYFGTTNPNIYKSINNGFTWNTPVSTTSTSATYTLLSLGTDKLVVGTSNGSVLFSKDGATTWTACFPIGAGTTNQGIQIAASGLDSGAFIYAAPGNTKDIYRCDIGAANPTYAWKTMSLTTANPQSANLETTTGLMLVGSVLYAVSTNISGGGNGPTYLNSSLTPNLNAGGYLPAGAWRTEMNSNLNGFAPAFCAAQIPSALKASTSTGKITLWAINTYSNPPSNPIAVRYFDDTLALIGPTLSGPVDKALIQTNSVNGGTMNVNLMWARPSLATGYDIQVALDSGFNSLVTNISKYGTINVSPTTWGFVDGTAATMAIVLGPAAGFNPGATYYWRIRASSPISSAWSETRSFTVQPLAAEVPDIISPVNGSTITNQSPAFSWNPVTSATQYDFQLSTTPTFGTTVLTDTPATAGTLVPVTIKLEQGKQYFWRVRAALPIQGDWSAVANFIVAMPAPTTAPPVTVTNPPAITITVPVAPSTIITIPPNVVNQIAPTYIWAIIIIGGILVIAVIVLIVRTRRSV